MGESEHENEATTHPPDLNIKLYEIEMEMKVGVGEHENENGTLPECLGIRRPPDLNIKLIGFWSGSL